MLVKFFAQCLSLFSDRFYYVLSQALAWLMLHYHNHSAARVIKRNIALVYATYSIDAQRRLLRQTLFEQAYAFFITLKVWMRSIYYAKTRIKTVDGEDLLLNALNNGKGTIAIVPHFGCWEVMNAWLADYTTAMCLYKPFKRDALDRIVRDARQKTNNIVVPTDESGLRKLLAYLKQGGMVVILPDHTPHAAGGVVAPFMGIDVLTTTLASKLAARTGANVLLMSAQRVPHDMHFAVRIEPVHANIYSKDIMQSVTAMNSAVHSLILRCPEQYHWSYKRYKSTQGLIDYYHEKEDTNAAQMTQGLERQPIQ